MCTNITCKNNVTSCSRIYYLSCECAHFFFFSFSLAQSRLFALSIETEQTPTKKIKTKPSIKIENSFFSPCQRFQFSLHASESLSSGVVSCIVRVTWQSGKKNQFTGNLQICRVFPICWRSFFSTQRLQRTYSTNFDVMWCVCVPLLFFSSEMKEKILFKYLQSFSQMFSYTTRKSSSY